MLLSLKHDLQIILHTHLSKFQVQLEQIEERTDQIERKISEYLSAYSDLVDDHESHSADLLRMKNKLADLEDRSRRNSLKFRGILESVPPSELTLYIQQLLKMLLPNERTQDLILDRPHRNFKPTHNTCRILSHEMSSQEYIFSISKSVPQLQHANLDQCLISIFKSPFMLKSLPQQHNVGNSSFLSLKPCGTIT